MREDPRIQGIFPFTYDSSVDNNGHAKWAFFEQNVNPLKAAMRKKWATEPIPQPKPFSWAAPGPSTPLPGPEPEPGERATGIDVSQYQDQNLNWQALREAGFSFFFWRLTRGLSLDRAGFRHPNQSAGAGLLSGPYHYLDATYGAREQARFFYSVLNDFPDGLVPVIDVEDDLLTPRNVRDCIDRFRELSGYWPMVYTSKYKWEKIVGRGATWAKQCPLWVAHAGVESPALPDIWDHWTFWQRGQTLTPAYPTKLDHNLFNGTEAQLRANFTHQPDDPEEPEKPPSIGVDFTVTHRPGIEAIIGNYPTPGLYATLRDPWGNTQSLITGSKPEYGAGGFLFNTWSLATYTLHIDGRDYPVKTVPLHTSFITFS
jgi:lysozyme